MHVCRMTLCVWGTQDPTPSAYAAAGSQLPQSVQTAVACASAAVHTLQARLPRFQSLVVAPF